jgi:serine protease
MLRWSCWCGVLAVGFALCPATGGTAGGQATSHRTVVRETTVGPLIRGIQPTEAHGPGSIERTRRAGIQRMTADRVGASGARYVPGRVLVKFKDDALPSARLSAVSAARSTARVTRAAVATDRLSHANFDTVAIGEQDDAEAVAEALRQRTEVEYAQPAYRIERRFVPDDRYYPLQWNLPLIDLERAWDLQPAAGSTRIVAVLDTGIAFTDATIGVHAYPFVDGEGTVYPSLGDLVLRFVAAPELGSSERFVDPYDFIWNDNTPVDMDGHGTHVAGTIGQLTNNGAGGGDTDNGGGTAGVAFNVKIMPVKVLDGPWDIIFGSPFQGTDDTVARGIRYAADRGAHVINMSLGRTGPPSPLIEDAIRYAIGRGAFIAIAGGNGYEDGNAVEVLAEIASRVSGAVSVAAVTRHRERAFYSTTGPYIELSAPGGSFDAGGATGGILQQTLDLDLVDRFLLPPARFSAPRFDALAYYYFTGTSQATPHVSGLAAMLMQQGVDNPATVEAALERVAVDLGPPGRDSTFGYGLVSARAALRGLGLAR